MPDRPAYTQSVDQLIEQFATLPGIGRRTAERLTFHVLKSSNEDALRLAHAIQHVKQSVRNCSVCFNLTEADPCEICRDSRRDPRRILVVEQPKDVITFQQTRAHDGVYHVLLGHLSPLDGVGPSDLTIPGLIDRVRKLLEDGDTPPEVILGTNPNMEGDGTAMAIAAELDKLGPVNVTRLARGVPTGSQLEYASKSVISDAIHGRQSIK
ncbi:MAG: recombination protein RecR [Planctomycetaceae bacterium]|nr:recombination protein RecR [Planctomycetaceae bacterium]